MSTSYNSLDCGHLISLIIYLDYPQRVQDLADVSPSLVIVAPLRGGAPSERVAGQATRYRRQTPAVSPTNIVSLGFCNSVHYVYEF